jgi:RNA polymerase sigma factor (sigma-70 family)
VQAYVSERDHAAFEGLVRRHGGMVLGVCRRVLRNLADAEDAFQATFLVLVRKAASIRSPSAVGNWLYGVAHITALRAKAMNRKRRNHELKAGTLPRQEAREEAWVAVQALLDAELVNLPDKHRIPIVLCDLEGKTIKEAARHLGWPQGTVATRLARGRALLARRLARHGLVLSAGALTAALSHGAAAANVPGALVLSTVKATSLSAAGQAMAAGVISAKVAALTQGVIQAMFLTKLKSCVVGLVTLAVLGMGATSVYQGTFAQEAGSSLRGALQQPGKQVQDSGTQADLKQEIERLRAELERTRLELERAQRQIAVLKAQADLARAEAEAALLKAQIDALKGKAPLPDKPDERLPRDLNQPGAKVPNQKPGPTSTSPDGRTVAVADGNRIILLDAQTKRIIARTEAHAEPVGWLVFSPDGKRLVSGGRDRVILFWDVPSGKQIRQLVVPNNAPTTVRFSPDGRTIIAVESDGTQREIDAETGKELRVIRRQSN